jgi:ankyrin repeat protein
MGDTDRVSALLAQGADANADDNGFTALMWVARSGNVHLAQLLIDHRSNVNAHLGRIG